MKKVLHKAESRGHANHGWLDTHHSFSFAGYYNPERMHFGRLRVLNDDIIAPGAGFGTHPHDNMEIVSIALKGELAHKDSMGHKQVIGPGEVQVMSAGTGITHSEFNNSPTESAHFLQIWVFPDQRGHKPRYDQKAFDPNERQNRIQTLVAPDQSNGSLWLHQDTYFSLSRIAPGHEVSYEVHSAANGVYLFVIEGEVTVADEKLNPRDGLGVWETTQVTVKAESEAEILFIEVPMS